LNAVSDTIEIDGSLGEGGGQVLRTALALACVTGRAVRLVNVRAGRAKPGLMRQHRTCVLAAARVAGAAVEGAELGSTQVHFRPGPVVPGVFEFEIGSAGATGLVLQTVLWPLLLADGPSTVRLGGGTHVLAAPTFTFLRDAFLPCLARLGARVELSLLRPGYHPVGGGLVEARIEPAPALARLELDAAPLPKELHAVATVARIGEDVARRELHQLAALLPLHRRALHTRVDREALGPGNVVHVDVPLGDGRHEVFTGFGRRGVPAEEVATELALEVRAFLAARVAVGEHLADQLLLPMALGGGGSFTTTAPSLHTRTNAEVVARFLPVEFRFVDEGAGRHRLTVERR